MIGTDLVGHGSSLYYAIRFAPVQHREALTLTAGLYRQIRSVPLVCAEPAVARVKIDWWQDELARAASGKGEHPLTQDLDRKYLIDPGFNQLIEAVREEINTPVMATESALERRTGAIGSTLCRLLASACSADRQELACAEAIGRFIHTVEIIRHLGGDLRRGVCLLPAPLLQQHDLSPSGLLGLTETTALEALLEALVEDAMGQCTNALARLSSPPHPALTSPLGLASIASALVDQLRKERYQVIDHRISLTPLVKLWRCWRSQRKVKQTRTLTPE